MTEDKTKTPVQTYSDEETRRMIREQLDVTFMVEASAGTGKTSELIGRILAVIGSGVGELKNMIAVTFTDKAAGELKLRLREALEEQRAACPAGSPERKRHEDAVLQLELAAVGTIHGLCTEILREYPVVAGIDPSFVVASESQARALQEEAFTQWFENALADPPRPVERVLRSSGWKGPRAVLWDATRLIIQWRDFPAAWPLPKGNYADGMAELVDRMEALGVYAARGNPEDWLTRDMAMFHEVSKSLRALQNGHGSAVSTSDSSVAELPRSQPLELADGDPDDHVLRLNQDRMEGILREFATGRHWSHVGFKDEAFGAVRSEQVRKERATLKEAFDLWLKRADAHLAGTLRTALVGVLAYYDRLKRQAGVLDFFDLLLRTRDLLAEKPIARAELRKRYSHIFVDEFQDTDPRQTEILWTLATETSESAEESLSENRLTPGKIFVVGDPKQALYRFRRADIASYDRAKKMFVEAGARLVHLSTSFRARPAIQRLINRAFEPSFGEGEEGVQAAYVPLAPAREALEGQPACVVLPMVTPYGKYGTDYGGLNDSGHEETAAFVDWLVRESGWQVEGRTGLRNVRPEDVCLLMTRMKSYGKDIAARYTDALARRGLPHVLADGRSFFERDEITAVRAALGAIEWPGDGLRVYATLRGPLFAFEDTLLLRWTQQVGSLDPLIPRSAESLDPDFGPLVRALRFLAELHVLRTHRPVSDTCSELLQQTRVQTAFALWPSGAQVLANVERLVNQARAYDREGGLSYRAFIESIDAAAEAPGEQARQATLVEPGSGGVRVMTVHAAKGLEFPVVILCDPGAPLKPKWASHYINAEEGLWAAELAGAMSTPLLQHKKRVLAEMTAENIRKVYVAATRARDLLVIPGIGDHIPSVTANLWIDPLLDAVTPERAARKKIKDAPGCPAAKGTDTVLFRPRKVEPLRGLHVRPGLQWNGLVWWDPENLKLTPPARVGLRGAHLLRNKDQHGSEMAAQGKEQRDRFVKSAKENRSAAGRPTLRSRTVSAASQLEAVRGLGVSVVSTEASVLARPRGARFGTLVHAVLADVPLADVPLADVTLADVPLRSDSKSGLHGLARFHGRALGATEEEMDAAVVAALSALDHPVFQRAGRSSDVRREVMLVHTQPDGVILEGVADLVFVEEDPFGGRSWVVVDFKTDLQRGADAHYTVQIELYMAAVQAATGEGCEGVLFGI